jgi:hypothetical protein
MLVTAQHIMAGTDEDDDYVVPTGREEMYQEVVNRNKKVGFALRAFPLRDDVANEVDTAMCDISPGVQAEFYLHDSGHDQPQYRPRRITAGTAEAVGPVHQIGSPTTRMELTMLGGVTGEKTVRVQGVGRFESFGGKSFRGLVQLIAPIARSREAIRAHRASPGRQTGPTEWFAWRSSPLKMGQQPSQSRPLRSRGTR